MDMYRHTANAMGGTWCGVSCQITKDVIEELDVKEKARAFALTSTQLDQCHLFN
jgi:hypothetical protein